MDVIWKFDGQSIYIHAISNNTETSNNNAHGHVQQPSAAAADAADADGGGGGCGGGGRVGGVGTGDDYCQPSAVYNSFSNDQVRTSQTQLSCVFPVFWLFTRLLTRIR